MRDFPKGKTISVADCFSGERESIWTQLRKEFRIEYLALDLKHKERRLVMDSLRYLQNPNWRHDVIDLDAYGSPWQHWKEVLNHGTSCVVFLTVGAVAFKRQKIQSLEAIGLNFPVPLGLHNGLVNMTLEYNLAACLEKFTVEKALEAENPHGTSRYFGVRIVLKSGADSGKIKASENKNKNTKKEPK